MKAPRPMRIFVVVPRASHDHFRGLRGSFLAPGSERVRPVRFSPSAPPPSASRLLLPAVVHDFRLAPDGFHQALFG